MIKHVENSKIYFIPLIPKRGTVEILDALNWLKAVGIRVIFEQGELDTANIDSDLMISINK